jgi:hypothetical protein
MLSADCEVVKDRPTTAFPHWEENNLLYYFFALLSRQKYCEQDIAQKQPIQKQEGFP